MGIWSGLLPDLLLAIAKHTTSRDHVILKAVCREWGSTLKSNICVPCNQLPWLLLPKQSPCCRFYSLSGDEFYELDFPEAYEHRCFGSAEGWLIMCGRTPSVFMMNPVTRARIELPAVTTFPHFHGYDGSKVHRQYSVEGYDLPIRLDTMSSSRVERLWMMRATVAGNPSTDSDYAVMAIYGATMYRLAYCRPGDDKWNLIEDTGGSFKDVIYWKGLFYAVSGGGIRLVSCDLKAPLPVVKQIITTRARYYNGDTYCYLVVSADDELWLILRAGDDYYTEKELQDMEENPGGEGSEEDLEEDNDDEYHRDLLKVEHDGVEPVPYYPPPCQCQHQHDSDANTDDEEENASTNEEDEDDADSYSSYNYSDASHYYLVGCFQVYEADVENQTWIRVRNIGDQVLFVGTNKAMCFRARDFPECKPNHVYFTNDQTAPGFAWEHDIGAMDLETGEIERFPCCSGFTNLRRPAPVWLTPSLQ